MHVPPTDLRPFRTLPGEDVGDGPRRPRQSRTSALRHLLEARDRGIDHELALARREAVVERDRLHPQGVAGARHRLVLREPCLLDGHEVGGARRNMAQYNHVGHLEEYQWAGGAPQFQRTLLKIKRPYFNHTGFQSLVWSPEQNTLVLGLGDGGSEYDPNNIAQDDNQLSGKLLKIDLSKLRGRHVTNDAPVATFTDLQNQGVPAGAFTTLVKGMRNPSKVHYEQVNDDEEKRRDDDDGNRWIKYLANTGQDTIEFIHGFDRYGINFGFRPWEGIFPTSFEPDEDTRVIAYGLEAVRLPNFYRPLVAYTHLDEALGPNANTGSALYRGNGIPGLKGQLVFTDWISFARTPPQGLLMHAPVNRKNLQEVQTIKLFNVDLSDVGLTAGQPIFYTAINTNGSSERIFVGGFKDIQFIVNQRNSALGSPGLAGGLYEVIRK